MAEMTGRAGRALCVISQGRDSFLLAVTLFVFLTNVVCASVRASAAITQTSPTTQSAQLPESSSDAVVESLDRALSEGKAEEAHDLLIQILKRPHLTSDFLLRVGIRVR